MTTHQAAYNRLRQAADFLLNHEDLPTPTVSVDARYDGLHRTTLAWHFTGAEKGGALDVLRQFDGWTTDADGTRTSIYTTSADGIDLHLYFRHTDLLPNLLDALAEVTA